MKIPRRALLRGAGVAVALPFLDVMRPQRASCRAGGSEALRGVLRPERHGSRGVAPEDGGAALGGGAASLPRGHERLRRRARVAGGRRDLARRHDGVRRRPPGDLLRHPQPGHGAVRPHRRRRDGRPAQGHARPVPRQPHRGGDPVPQPQPVPHGRHGGHAGLHLVPGRRSGRGCVPRSGEGVRHALQQPGQPQRGDGRYPAAPRERPRLGARRTRGA